MSGRITSERRQRIAGLGQSTREVKVGTFNSGGVSRSIPSGQSEDYSFEVVNGSAKPGDEAQHGKAEVTRLSNNRIRVSGRVWGPGGFDNWHVTGRIENVQTGPDLVFQGQKNGAGAGSGGGQPGPPSDPPVNPIDPPRPPVQPVQPQPPARRKPAPRQPQQPRQPSRPAQPQQAGMLGGSMMPVLLTGGIVTAGIVTAMLLSNS